MGSDHTKQRISLGSVQYTQPSSTQQFLDKIPSKTLTSSTYTSRLKRLNFEFRNIEVHINLLKLTLKDLHTFMFSRLTLFNA